MNTDHESQTQSQQTISICVKVENLRKIGYSDLKQWMDNPTNLYVGRRGRIFITNPQTKERKIFHYKESKWANPYPVGDGPTKYSLEKSLELYQKHLQDSDLIKDIGELKGKNLGCFCVQSKKEGKQMCHAQILAQLANLG